MKVKLKLAWKLTAAAAVILTAAVVLTNLANSQVPLLLGVVALWLMFAFLLEKPLGELIAGTKQLAAHELDFRFDRKRNDEIGVLQESFNAMAATIQASQEELRGAKEYLEGMVENSADIIISVNSEGLIETFNRGGEEALDYRREEVIGKRIESLYVDPSERHAAAARLEDTNDLKNYETRLLAKDGRARNVLLTLSRLRDAEGSPIGTIGISKDVTHEKAILDELRDAKQYLEGMVEHSADIIISVNSEGLIETFNRGGEEALGYRRQEVIGTQIESMFVDPRERQAAMARLEGTDDVTNYETRLRAKDGQVRNVLLTLSRLFDAEGNRIGTIGISKDITREKRLQRELIQSQKFAAIGEAVTGIQHAIKNMLDALNGGAYLVRVGMGKDNPERIEEGLAMVEEGMERISALSRNMLNFAREWKADLQKVDLSDLIESIRELNRQAAVDHGVILRHEVSEGLPPVLCDPKLIHMATTDILVNAIDACTEKRYADGQSAEIVLRTYLGENGDFAVIEVRDNGCGMTEEIRRNIFTPFFSTKDTLGTGLGLALTARIIRVHGGEILVDSEPDRGTTFRVNIPKDGPINR
jgi:PAS domain S-box-containing protein